MSGTTVSETVKRRYSARMFTDQQVEASTIREILADAAQAPSNGNVQPWKVTVAQGQGLAAALGAFNKGLYQDGKMEESQYAIYPKTIDGEYKERRAACGELMYEALGIARDDKTGRIKQVMKNFGFFGAPTGLIISMREDMGLGQAIDIGIFVQNILLLANERGLAACPQASWAQWPNRVRTSFNIPDDEMILMGIAIGYADENHAVNLTRQPRIEVDQFATFL